MFIKISRAPFPGTIGSLVRHIDILKNGNSKYNIQRNTHYLKLDCFQLKNPQLTQFDSNQMKHKSQSVQHEHYNISLFHSLSKCITQVCHILLCKFFRRLRKAPGNLY